MAKAIATGQTSYNGAITASIVVLNTAYINGLAAEGTGSNIYYKNLDGSMVNIIGSNDIVADLLLAMNAANTSDITMLTLPDAVSGLDFYVPTSAVYMATELSSGNCLLLYSTSAKDSFVEVEIALTATDLVDAMNA